MPAAATAVTKSNTSQVATLATLLLNVNAAIAALNGPSTRRHRKLRLISSQT